MNNSIYLATNQERLKLFFPIEDEHKRSKITNSTKLDIE